MATRRGGRASQRMTELVLETYGRVCHLRLKGCKGVATTKDHIVPYSHGGADTIENYRPACKSCNSKRQNRVMYGYGASVVVLTGPPASGKTTYVNEHAKPTDVVIDFDAICRALMPVAPEQSHTYPAHVRWVAVRARKAAVNAATRLKERTTVWLIHAIPVPDDLADYKRLGWQIITIDPGREVVEARARTMRPPEQMLHVARWYATYGAAIIEPAHPESPTADDTESDW